MNSTDPETIPRVHTDAPELATTHLGRGAPAPRIDSEDPAHETQRQAAFDSAFEWRGKELHPFSISRESLFHQLRLAIGAPVWDSCIEDTYAFTADAARILWLCAHTPKDWSLLRCSPAVHQNAIDEWTEANISPRETAAARLLAMDILVAAARNAHEAAPATQRAHGDDLGN